MSSKNILKQMGVQQWRLRKNSDLVVDAAPTKVLPESASKRSPRIKQYDLESVTESVNPIIVENKDVTWLGLAKILDDQKGCPSCAQSKPILGDGDPVAKWMFVFDSPNSRDIEHQKLLTGRQGQLFDSILSALSLDREQVYLSSIFKCPPAEDIKSGMPQCNDLLLHQIRLVQPKVIVAFGEFVAQSLIKANEKLALLRQQPRQYFDQSIAVIPTHSLMDMMESPLLKGQTWTDLKSAIEIVEGN